MFDKSSYLMPIIFKGLATRFGQLTDGERDFPLWWRSFVKGKVRDDWIFVIDRDENNGDN